MSDTVRLPTAELKPPAAAVNATLRGPVKVLSNTPVTENVALACPMGMVRLAGKATAAAGEALRFTLRLEEVVVLRVMVPTVLLPLAMEEAAKDIKSEGPWVSRTVSVALVWPLVIAMCEGVSIWAVNVAI